ncbi:MAG: TIR domain-containing protein [Chloroflexota bacterium]
MPRIFISYSHVDRPFVDELVVLLREVYELENVWVDENIYGGQLWWDEILRQIASCDLFIYLLSNESLISEYCLAEYHEAQRLQKQIIPVQVRGRTAIPNEMKQIQYVDMSSGIRNGINKLHAAITKSAAKLQTISPQPITPVPVSLPHVPTILSKPKWRVALTPRRAIITGMIIAAIVGAAFISNREYLLGGKGDNIIDALLTQTATSTQSVADIPTATQKLSITISPTSTFFSKAVDTPTSISTPTFTHIASLLVTVNSDTANLRSGPSTQYPPIGTAVKGDSFEIIAKDGNEQWLLVLHPTLGAVWISTQVLVRSYNAAQIPTVDPSIIPSIPTLAPTNDGKYVCVLAQVTPLSTSPGGSFIDFLYAGVCGNVISTGSFAGVGFYKVQLEDGQIGWIQKSAVEIQ